ncbi:unnamed protein product [Brassica oleracea]
MRRYVSLFSSTQMASSSSKSICSGLGLFVLRPVLISLRLNFCTGQVLGGAGSFSSEVQSDEYGLMSYSSGTHRSCILLVTYILQIISFYSSRAEKDNVYTNTIHSESFFSHVLSWKASHGRCGSSFLWV